MDTSQRRFTLETCNRIPAGRLLGMWADRNPTAVSGSNHHYHLPAGLHWHIRHGAGALQHHGLHVSNSGSRWDLPAAHMRPDKKQLEEIRNLQQVCLKLLKEKEG